MRPRPSAAGASQPPLADAGSPLPADTAQHLPLAADAKPAASGISWTASLGGGSKRVGIKHVLAMTEQLLTLLDAGLPLDRALHICQSSIEQPFFRGVMQAVVVDVEKGNSLGDAFMRHPRCSRACT